MIGISFEVRCFIVTFLFRKVVPRTLIQLTGRLQNSHIFPFTEEIGPLSKTVLSRQFELLMHFQVQMER